MKVSICLFVRIIIHPQRNVFLSEAFGILLNIDMKRNNSNEEDIVNRLTKIIAGLIPYDDSITALIGLICPPMWGFHRAKAHTKDSLSLQSCDFS